MSTPLNRSTSLTPPQDVVDSDGHSVKSVSKSLKSSRSLRSVGSTLSRRYVHSICNVHSMHVHWMRCTYTQYTVHTLDVLYYFLRLSTYVLVLFWLVRMWVEVPAPLSCIVTRFLVPQFLLSDMILRVDSWRYLCPLPFVLCAVCCVLSLSSAICRSVQVTFPLSSLSLSSLSPSLSLLFISSLPSLSIFSLWMHRGGEKVVWVPAEEYKEPLDEKRKRKKKQSL